MKYLPDVSRIFSDDKSGCLINDLSQRFFPCETSDYIHLFTENINFEKNLSSENNKTEKIFCYSKKKFLHPKYYKKNNQNY